jgi:hypothetical protein
MRVSQFEIHGQLGNLPNRLVACPEQKKDDLAMQQDPSEWKWVLVQSHFRKVNEVNFVMLNS